MIDAYLQYGAMVVKDVHTRLSSLAIIVRQAVLPNVTPGTFDPAKVGHAAGLRHPVFDAAGCARDAALSAARQLLPDDAGGRRARYAGRRLAAARAADRPARRHAPRAVRARRMKSSQRGRKESAPLQARRPRRLQPRHTGDPAMLDVFSNAVFDVWSLTASINNRPYQPGLIGSLNLFDPQMLTTTTALIEVTGERLALVPERPRGAPPTPDVSDNRALVPMRIPHFPIRTTIFADEVQNVRAFGTDNQLVAVHDVIDRREASLGRKLDVTQEYLRLGAVKGIVVTEADRESGAPMTQYSLFDQFNVDPQPVIYWPIIGAGAAA